MQYKYYLCMPFYCYSCVISFYTIKVSYMSILVDSICYSLEIKKFERFVRFEKLYLKYNNSACNLSIQYDFDLQENVRRNDKNILCFIYLKTDIDFKSRHGVCGVCHCTNF